MLSPLISFARSVSGTAGGMREELDIVVWTWRIASARLEVAAASAGGFCGA